MLAAGRALDGRERGRAYQRPAAASRHHVPRRGPEREEGAVEVDLEHAAPLLALHLHERGGAAPADAGVGKAAVDAAEHAQSLGEGRLYRLLVGDVADEGEDLAPGLGQLALGGGVLGDVGAPDRHVGAGVSHRPRHAQANAAVAARHQGHLAGQIEGLVHRLARGLTTVTGPDSCAFA